MVLTPTQSGFLNQATVPAASSQQVSWEGSKTSAQDGELATAEMWLLLFNLVSLELLPKPTSEQGTNYATDVMGYQSSSCKGETCS